MGQSKFRPAKRLDFIPESNAPRIRVVRLKGKERIKGVVLCTSFYGFEIHWNDSKKRSVPHYDDEETCEGCQCKLPRKTVYYLHLVSPDRGQYYLEMPPDGMRKFLDQVAPGESLRGLSVVAWRSEKDNGRVRCQVEEYTSRKDNLPPAIDPEPTLQALWNWERRP